MTGAACTLGSRRALLHPTLHCAPLRMYVYVQESTFQLAASVMPSRLT